jgi:stage V sporulation protein G
MELTEVRINLCGDRGGRLKAFCSLTFDNTFVIRDVKLIDGNDGLFLAMPSRKLCDHCPACHEKNHLRARYCNNCGRRLNEERYQQCRNGNAVGHAHANCNGHANGGNANGHAYANGHRNGNGNGHGNGHAPGARLKLHADIAHPINAECRQDIERKVLEAYDRELERSREPGYVAPSLDAEDFDLYDDRPARPALRPTGTSH